MRLIVAVALLLAAVAQATSVPFTSCDAHSHLKVSAVDAVPFPPKIGKDATITVTGTLDEAVTGGAYTVTVIAFGIPLASFTGGICDLGDCPLKAGSVKLSKTLAVPAFAPPGTYTIQVSATDQNGKSLVCVSVNVQLSGAAELLPLPAPQFDTAFPVVEVISAPMNSIPFTTCASGTPFTPQAVDATPYPPVKGQDCAVTVTGKLTESVTGGTYTINVYFLGIPFNSITGSVCELGTCPFNSGTAKMSRTLPIPAFAPSGSYTVKVQASDQHGKELTCINVGISISSTGAMTFEDALPML